MEVKGKITEKDYLLSQYLHMKPRLAFAIVGVILITLAIFVLIVKFSFSMLASLLVLAALFFGYIPYKAKKAYRSYAALSELVEVSIEKDGVKFKSNRGEGIVFWSDIRKVKSNSKLALIYPANNIFHLLPRHFFSSDSEFQEFLQCIKLHGKTST